MWWCTYKPAEHLVENHPGMDNRPEISSDSPDAEKIIIGEYFEKFDTLNIKLPGEWDRFRGSDSRNIVESKINLADKWPESGPEILWSVELGEGHAAPSVIDGRVYLLDYDEASKSDALRCFSLTDGRELWRRWYNVKVKRNHGMSRTIPAVTKDYVVSIGPRCHVMCVAAKTGNYLWGLDLEKDFGTETPFWYTGQCPIIDDSTVIIAPGGNSLIIGINCASGEIVWETPNPNKWKMSHSSVMPMTLAGRKMYVYCAIGGIVAVSADSADAGTVLWETSLWNHSVLAPSPVIIEDGRIFLTAGYGAGSMVLQVKEENGKFIVQKLQEFKPKDGMASEQQTPLYYNGYFYNIQPKDAGELRQQFVCYHPDDCTKLIWSSGTTNRFGLGPFIIADDKFYILNDDGALIIAQVSARAFKQLDRVKILDGHDAWGPLAIVGDRMLLRDSKKMVCIYIGES